ncbi:phosphatase PAP2 family protein [Halorubrum terrestre]|uniref:Phosphatase PAP2 family protein n=2 Tax=Halorubrum distributum TaxID=29283 RepID=A0A6B1IGD5_9EURY|nr:phosphatase PAP2 family protein [Halorubrum terrestre]
MCREDGEETTMALLRVTALTGLSVAVGTAVTALLCVGPRQLSRATNDLGGRAHEVAPYLAAALGLLAVKQLTQGYRIRLSRALDWRITGELYAIEGEFVAALQRATPDATLEPFSVAYMLGFAVLLVAGPTVYFLAGAGGRRHLKELLVAYMLNYAVGTLCYTLFIGYGPRKYLDSVDGLMYQFYPETQELTAAVASNTNVFPSLHASLSVAVAAVAWRSRRRFPRWAGISGTLAAAVVYSTMFLGIHWATDVVVGAVLGAGSATVGARIVTRVERRSTGGGPEPLDGPSADRKPEAGDD